MSSVKNVVIAAAGMGGRLGAGIPKCLVDVAGKRIIEYQLDLLKEIENIYIIVGFCENEVMHVVKELRPDVIFVRNSNFQHTTTLESFSLATKIIDGNCLLMDGDMIIDKQSFGEFVRQCESSDSLLIGVSKRITDDPVYAHVKEGTGQKKQLEYFSLDDKSNYEWSNLAYLPANQIICQHTHLYQFLQSFLPAHCVIVDRFEIDTNEDLKNAVNNLHLLGWGKEGVR